MAHQADKWIEAAERRREQLLGGIVPLTVGMPNGVAERPDYPMGFKKCVQCHESSERKLRLDGKPFYHKEGLCGAARMAYYRSCPA